MLTEGYGPVPVLDIAKFTSTRERSTTSRCVAPSAITLTCAAIITTTAEATRKDNKPIWIPSDTYFICGDFLIYDM